MYLSTWSSVCKTEPWWLTHTSPQLYKLVLKKSNEVRWDKQHRQLVAEHDVYQLKKWANLHNINFSISSNYYGFVGNLVTLVIVGQKQCPDNTHTDFTNSTKTQRINTTQVLTHESRFIIINHICKAKDQPCTDKRKEVLTLSRHKARSENQ